MPPIEPIVLKDLAMLTVAFSFDKVNYTTKGILKIWSRTVFACSNKESLESEQ